MNATICPECHSRRVTSPDKEGLVDCLACGIWWEPDHPRNQIAEYQVSTPRFTCWIAVHDGKVVDCCPYLRRTILGKPWHVVAGSLGALYGARITELTREEPV